MAEDEQQRQVVSKDTGLFQFENPREQKIYETIKWLVADGPAEFFKDACNLMHDPKNLSTASHLVGHLMRELDSGIRAVLAPLAQQIDKDSTTKHVDGIKAILLALKVPESEGPGKAWIDLAEKLHGKAHRPNLGSPRPLDDEFREDWQHFIRILEAVLDRFEKCYEGIFKELDILLKAGTSPKEGISVLQTRIPNSYVALDYFFSRLQDPQWLQPLYDAGFFKELSLDRPCPQTKYLERMAAHTEYQQVALDIILALETESIGARCDLADATLVLPAASGVKTVPKFIRYFEASPNLFILPYALTKLAKHLAPEYPKEAQELTAALLVITPQEGGTDIFREPKTRIQSHDYGHVLEEVIPSLAESGGFPVFELLCDLLCAAVESRRGDGEERDFDDNSYIERHAIDGYHGMHLSHEVTNGLITAVYQTAGKILEKDSSVMKRIINILDTKRWAVFQRIALQLLCDSAGPPQELVAQKLLSKDLWDNETTKREYFMLAETHSGLLTPTQREEIARRIQAGPEWTIEDLEQEQIDRLVRSWRWRRLVPFREILPPQLQRECDDIVDDLGEPPDEPAVSSARSIGSVSPIEKEKLEAKTIEEIVSYLQKWVPTGEWEEPDPDGLGDVLRNAVIDDPVRFAEKAELFVEADPTYVRSLLGGLGEAVKAERQFSWAGVLKLCAAVLQKPVKIPGRVTRRIFDFDADWNGARRGILDLLTKGLMEGPVSIPFTLRTDVWSILQTLTEDPDPTPEDEAKQDRKNMNPYDEAVNTMRGNALETVVFYISWVLRELKIKAGIEGRIEGGMQHVPEAAAVFEAHLDPLREHSRFIHSLYGKWLPNLDYTDHQWTEQVLPRILPRDPAKQHLRDAVWNTYLLYSGGPYNKTASMLIPEYRFSADHLEAMPPSARGDLKEAFATHLAFLYLRGILKKDGEDGTIVAFIQKADAKLRGQFVRIMGDIVRHNKKPSREWIERAMHFWEERLEVAKTASDPSQHTQEMDAFGYWFVSRKFDDDWALKNLESALRLGFDIEFDYHIVENLESMARARPLECVRCLQLIVTSKGKSVWDVRLLVKHTRTVLDVISASGDAEAKVIGDEVVSALLARGHQEIREAKPAILAV